MLVYDQPSVNNAYGELDKYVAVLKLYCVDTPNLNTRPPGSDRPGPLIRSDRILQVFEPN
jgi:hypothetical protein